MIASNPSETRMNTPADRLEEFQKLGFSFFPLLENSKKPRSSWDHFQSRTPESREITNWLYLRYPNYAIVTGQISGNLLGLDFDPHHMEQSPEDYLAQWPTGFVVRTPTGGYHAYYRLPDNIRIKSTTNALAAGIDSRGEGGYLVAPGSLVVYRGKEAISKGVEDGYQGIYTLQGLGDIAPIPASLLEALREHQLIIGERAHRVTPPEATASYETPKEAEIVNMLAVLPPEPGYDQWLHILMAVHSIFPDQRGIDLIEAWSPGYEGEVAEKFRSFEKGYVGKRITRGTLIYHAKQHGYQPRQSQPAHENTPAHADLTINEEYLPDDSLYGEDAVILISDMGTGKTTRVIELGGQKLIPNHRQRLSKALAQGFNAVNYRNEKNEIRSGLELSTLWANGQSLTCVINSLWRIAGTGRIPAQIPLLFIDEIRQVLAQLGGNTFKDQRAERAYNTLCALVKNAERVILADAHADQTVIEWLRHLRSNRQVTVIRNEYHRSRGPLWIYEDLSILILKIGELIEEGSGPVIIPTNSKRMAKVIEELLQSYCTPDEIMCIHSGVNNERTRYFIEHIHEEIDKYRVVIYSPTLGSGIDINRTSNDQLIEVRAICPILMKGILTAPDCHQLINRFRNTRETHVYIQKDNSRRETNPKRLYKCRLQEAIDTGIFTHYDEYGYVVATASQKRLHWLVSLLEAQDNWSKNNFQEHFLELARGYTSIEVVPGKDPSTWENITAARENVRLHDKALVLRSEPIDAVQYEMLAMNGQVSEEIEAGHLHWKIVQAAGGLDLTEALYDQLHDGKARQRLYLLTDVLEADSSELSERDRQESVLPIHKRGHHAQKTHFICEFIAQVYGTDGLNPKPLSKPVIERRVQGFMKQYGKEFTELFEKRSDTSAEPMCIFRWVICRLLGLKISSKQKQVNKQRYYRYWISDTALQQQQRLAHLQYAYRHRNSRQLTLIESVSVQNA